eukprot:TRINITY_DN57_c0_g1_i4.p1 TRINITY_DN57_c0_g1~~TRINITY_DN57_c0_g1_i4.p1  ORF type:complete len:164 (+),score=31.41 TRINITY_DN57_c0_g1_i4:56-493(+)
MSHPLPCLCSAPCPFPLSSLLERIPPHVTTLPYHILYTLQLCKFVEAKVGALPAGTVGAAKALSRARDLNIVEGRFLACRDFLGLCNEEVSDPLKGSSGKSYQELSDSYAKAQDPYWAGRNLYTMPHGAAAVQNALGTKSKTLKN